MSKSTTETTKAKRKPSRSPRKASQAVEMTPETKAQIRRIATMQRIRKRADRIASDLFDACNHRVSATAVTFIPTPKMQAAVDRARAAAHASNRMYLETVATPDLPDDILIHLLRVRVLYTPGGDDEWCAKIRALGGPRITPQWLFVYRHNHLIGRGDRIDPRVRKALILEDVEGAVPAWQQPG